MVHTRPHRSGHGPAEDDQYDWLTWEMVEDELKAHPYVELEDTDVGAVLAGCASKYGRE